MSKFSIEAFAEGCKRAMNNAASSEDGAKAYLEKAMKDFGSQAIIEALEAAIPAGASVGEMIVHCSDELTMLYARVPARFQSGIHNHTVFACIGQLEGSEVSTIYAKTKNGKDLKVSETLTANAGKVIQLGADAIHHIENPDNKTAHSLHLYGGNFQTIMEQRSLWDSNDHHESTFSFQGLIHESIKTMKSHNNVDGLNAVAQAIPSTQKLIEA